MVLCPVVLPLSLWSKLEKEAQLAQRKLVSGTQILAANVGLQTWVRLVTFLSFSNRSHL